MPASLRTVLTTTAALAAVVAFVVSFTLPPAAIRLGATLPATHVIGGYHVHTSRSDGTGTVEEIAAAAARSGLSFVVFTDHGDATRTPDPPAYRHGVLCIDAVEVNSASGHVVALGLNRPAPYPLAGTARDVFEDIHRMGGRAVIAHPDSPNADLRWRGQAPEPDGIEWLNADSEWRDEPPLTLLGTAAHGLIRGPAAVASVFTRPAATLARWDREALRHPTVGLAALDAHANIPWRDRQEPRRSTWLRFPGYQTMFSTLAQVVVLDAPLAKDAPSDAERVLAALLSGRSYSVIRAFAEPAALEFAAEQGSATAVMGGRLDASAITRLRASVAGAPGARVQLIGDGRTVASGSGEVRYAGAASPSAYRVEVTLPGHEMPWLVSNPIVVASATTAAPEPPRVPDATVPLPADTSAWTIEKEPTSQASVDVNGRELRFAFTIAAGTPRGQYAALVSAVPAELGVDRVQFTARADRPMRLSVQVRTPGSLGGQRWRRSVYLDTTPRTVAVPLEEFDPADGPSASRPIVARLQSLLFVVDTLNTPPGAGGTVWLADVALGTRAVTSER